MDYYQIIGYYFKRERERAKISQEELGKRLNLHHSYISKIETGKIHLEILTAYRLCRFLNISFDRVVRDIGMTLDALYREE